MTSSRKRLRPVVPADLARPVPPSCAIPARELTPQAAWARSATDDWGCCGVAAYEGDRLIGRLLVCPTVSTPPSHPLAAMAKTPSGAIVVSWWIDPDHAEAGVDRQLVQSVCAHLVGVPTLAAAGSPQGESCRVLPIDWLVDKGFNPQGSRGGVTRMVLDLGQTVRLGSRLRGALDQVAWWGRRPALESRATGEPRPPLD